MAIFRKIFGNRALDELIEKATKKNIIPEVFIERSREKPLSPNEAAYRYHIGIRVGRTTSTVSEWVSRFEDYEPLINGYNRLNLADAQARHVARQAAQDVFSRGLAVKINGTCYTPD